MFVYMQVTKDDLELPLAIADSIPKLAEMVGVKAKSIYDSMSRAKTLGYRTQYKKVDIGITGFEGCNKCEFYNKESKEHPCNECIQNAIEKYRRRTNEKEKQK